MNSYMQGLYGQSQLAPTNMQAAPGVQGNVSVSGGFGGTGAAANAGPIALIVILGGVVIFYFATRKLQGSI